MQFSTLEQALQANPTVLKPGAVAIIRVEDEIGVGSTIRHHARLGFRNIFVVGTAELHVPEDCGSLCVTVSDGRDLVGLVNVAIAELTGRWIYFCYNAEYLHFPFCEERKVDELIGFATEERRQSLFTYIIDLYAENLEANPDGYSLETAHLDGSGYYALARYLDGTALPRQLDIFGGLRWRYEEHFPKTKRRIDRVSLFQAKPGLVLDDQYLFNDQEYNTFECPWHNSPTIATCSFRSAKYLKTNPGSTFEVPSFMWSNSAKFHWNSQQLMDMGLIEPGQWF